MRTLCVAIFCAVAGISAWGAEAGGVTTSSSTTSSSGGSSTTITTRGSKAGEMEKAAGKASAGANGEKSVAAQAGHYFLSRWYDLVDVMDFSVGAGPGMLVNLHCTKLAQIAGGYSDAYHVGFRGRSAGIWREKRKEVGVSLLCYQKVERERITGWVESFRSEKMDLDTSAVYANNNDRSFLGVGAMIQAGVMVNVNVRPMQAIDFVLGWMTIDVLEDDTLKAKRNKDL